MILIIKACRESHLLQLGLNLWLLFLFCAFTTHLDEKWPIPHTAKLSSEKTFTVGMQMTIHGKTFAVVLLLTLCLA